MEPKDREQKAKEEEEASVWVGVCVCVFVVSGLVLFVCLFCVIWFEEQSTHRRPQAQERSRQPGAFEGRQATHLLFSCPS